MKATFKVTFLLQKGKLKASGKAPIVTRIIVNGEMAHFSTQQEIEPDRWDAKGNRTLGLRSEERTINMILDEIKASLHRYYYGSKTPVLPAFVFAVLRNGLRRL